MSSRVLRPRECKTARRTRNCLMKRDMNHESSESSFLKDRRFPFMTTIHSEVIPSVSLSHFTYQQFNSWTFSENRLFSSERRSSINFRHFHKTNPIIFLFAPSQPTNPKRQLFVPYRSGLALQNALHCCLHPCSAWRRLES
jgi:hypothetical protein